MGALGASQSYFGSGLSERSQRCFLWTPTCEQLHCAGRLSQSAQPALCPTVAGGSERAAAGKGGSANPRSGKHCSRNNPERAVSRGRWKEPGTIYNKSLGQKLGVVPAGQQSRDLTEKFPPLTSTNIPRGPPHPEEKTEALTVW